MKFSDHAIDVLAAKTYRGIGNAWIVKNMGERLTADAIVSLLNGSAKENGQITLDDFESSRERVREDIAELKGCIDGVVAIGDDNFPPCRGEVKNSERPVALFYRGNLSLLEAANRNVAVIGLLNPDNDTEETERAVVAELVKSGATIVSGLALGCDSIAHEQALRSSGNTVAILPSPLSEIMPRANTGLANAIVDGGGLLITEYCKSAASKIEMRGRYQERDRLQALFSDSIILSASYAKNDLGNDSGSRLAMGYAKNYSIPRAVIYDSSTNVNNPKYDLNRQLIEEQKEIFVINRSNSGPMVERIMSNGSDISDRQTIQPSLFG